jgi:hypothetical protein
MWMSVLADAQYELQDTGIQPHLRDEHKPNYKNIPHNPHVCRAKASALGGWTIEHAGVWANRDGTTSSFFRRVYLQLVLYSKTRQSKINSSKTELL